MKLTYNEELNQFCIYSISKFHKNLTTLYNRITLDEVLEKIFKLTYKGNSIRRIFCLYLVTFVSKKFNSTIHCWFKYYIWIKNNRTLVSKGVHFLTNNMDWMLIHCANRWTDMFLLYSEASYMSQGGFMHFLKSLVQVLWYFSALPYPHRILCP